METMTRDSGYPSLPRKVQRQRHGGEIGDRRFLRQQCREEGKRQYRQVLPFATAGIQQSRAECQQEEQHAENLVAALHIGDHLRVQGMDRIQQRDRERDKKRSRETEQQYAEQQEQVSA